MTIAKSRSKNILRSFGGIFPKKVENVFADLRLIFLSGFFLEEEWLKFVLAHVARKKV